MEAIASLCIFLLVLPSPATMQTSTTTDGGATSSIVISYSVALYVMIGIAAFYGMTTLLCCVLVVLNCFNGNKTKRRLKRVSPYQNIQYPLSRNLETIIEESESKCSSQTSLPKHQGKEPLSFANKSALEGYEKETPLTEPVPESKGDFEAGKDLSFANQSALDFESGKVTEEDSEDDGKLPKRGEVITTSFKKPVPMSKITEQNGDRERREPCDSPLLRYTPRSTPIPPAEVQVPFSEPKKLPKVSKLPPLRGRTSTSQTEPSKPPSPFRKHFESEIPAAANQSPLMKYKRKRSSDDALTDPVPKPNGKPKEVTTVKDARPQSGTSSDSPVRSRPKPKHPVRGSPSQSPYRPHIKDPLPSIATHSKTSHPAPDPPQSLSSNSSSSLPALTEESLLKELVEVKHKWYIIGLQLKLPHRCLNGILNQHRNDFNTCLPLMCKELMRSSKEVTWSMVVDVLKTDIVDEKELGSSLEMKYCWLESDNSKTYL